MELREVSAWACSHSTGGTGEESWSLCSNTLTQSSESMDAKMYSTQVRVTWSQGTEGSGDLVKCWRMTDLMLQGHGMHNGHKWTAKAGIRLPRQERDSHLLIPFANTQPPHKRHTLSTLLGPLLGAKGTPLVTTGHAQTRQSKADLLQICRAVPGERGETSAGETAMGGKLWEWPLEGLEQWMLSLSLQVSED